MVPAVSPTGA